MVFIFCYPHVAVFIAAFAGEFSIIKLANASIHIISVFKAYYSHRIAIAVLLNVGVDRADGFFNEIFKILPRGTIRKTFDEDTEGGVTGTEFTTGTFFALATVTITTSSVISAIVPAIAIAVSSIVPAIVPVAVVASALRKFYTKSIAIEIVVVATTDCVARISVEKKREKNK